MRLFRSLHRHWKTADGPSAGARGRRGNPGQGRVAKFRGATGAVAAVEFALIAPILLMLYMAGSEVAMAFTLNRKVQHTASTVNDLITQAPETTKAEVGAIFAVSSALVAPYDATKVAIKVTAVKINAEGGAFVSWSQARGSTPDASGGPFQLPADLAGLRSQSILVASTTYQYSPFGGYGLTTPFEMGGTYYLRPRVGTDVICTDC